MSERGDLDCREVEALAAEIALGSVSATERASALLHLRHCHSCDRLVHELASAADALLLLAPEAEPTIGFESRVLAATGAPERPPESRRRRSWLHVAAAALVVLLVGAGGLVAGLAAGNDGGDEVRSALAVTAGGRATCRAFAFGDDRAWVFVTLETPREWTADYSVEVTTADGGQPQPIGRLRLQGGEATLAAAVDGPAERLRRIRVLDASGALRYEAPFTTA